MSFHSSWSSRLRDYLQRQAPLQVGGPAQLPLLHFLPRWPGMWGGVGWGLGGLHSVGAEPVGRPRG